MRYGKVPISLAMFCVCSSQCVFAEESKQTESKPKEQSVYEASTTAPEAVQIKSLSKEEFSKFAAGICEKYGFDGPKEISSETDRINLLNKLRDLRKEKFKELSDPKVRADEAAKKKVQDQMKCLTDEIKYFPNLASNRLVEEAEKIVSTPPSLAKNRIPYGALLNCPSYKDRAALGPPSNKTTFSSIAPLPSPNQNPVPGINTGIGDNIDVVRDEIRKKHGDYYAPLKKK